MFISNQSNKKPNDIKASALINTEKCGCCLENQFIKLTNYSQTPEVNFIKCKNCGAVTYDKIYNQKEIDLLYEEDKNNDISLKYYIDENGNQTYITFHNAQRFAKHLLKKYNVSKKKYRILDFGGGDGQMAYCVGQEMQKKFEGECELVEITVVDYIDALYNTTDTQIVMKHCFPLESVLAEQKFDLVIASAIIEHLPDPINHIKVLFKTLEIGGFLYIRTPYMYPLYRDLKKIGINYDTLYPFHIWDLGAKWYNQLPKIIGYDQKEITVVSSKPSIVEKTFKSNFWIALASYILKAPWFICHKWPYVGGWEAIYTKVK